MQAFAFIQAAVAQQFFIEVTVSQQQGVADDELVLAITLESGQFIMQYYLVGFSGVYRVVLTCDINTLSTMEQCTELIANGTPLMVKLYRNHEYYDQTYVYRLFRYDVLRLRYSYHFQLNISDSDGLTPLIYCYGRNSYANVWPAIPGLPIRDGTTQLRCSYYKNDTLQRMLRTAKHLWLFNHSVIDNWNQCEVTNFAYFQYCDIQFLEDTSLVYRLLIQHYREHTSSHHLFISFIFVLCVYQVIYFVFYLWQQLRHATTIRSAENLILDAE